MADIKIRILAGSKKRLKDAAALSELVFKSRFFTENYMKEPAFRPSNIRLLYEGKTLASMACVLPRKMNLDGFKLKLAGVGGVATDPHFRGRGYASRVMEDAVSYMSNRGFALSHLYPYKSAFYRQFGYSDITFPFRVIDISRIQKPGCSFRIKKLEKPDYRALKKVYDTFNKNLTGTIDRPLPYWKNYCEYWVDQAKKMCWKEEPFFCAYDRKTIIAYIRVSALRKTWDSKEHGVKISEFACLPGYEKAFGCLLYAARKCAARQGHKKLFFEDIKGVEIPRSRPVTAAEKKEYMNLKHIKMYMISDFETLMKTLGPVLSKRLEEAGNKGGWKKFVKIKRVVRSSGPAVFISSKDSKKTVILDDHGFIRLVLGLKTIKSGPTLRAAFPLLKPVYWDFDYL